MPTISTENTDQLTHIITVNIAKEDYEKSLNEELKKIRAKAHLKGFRKGQVPMSYIKKMYGKSILAEELNRMAYNEVMKYLVDSDVETLGQPIPAEGQTAPELDIKTYQDYSFQFEIGLQPKIEVQGADKTTSLTLYEIEIEEELVEESIDRFRIENGLREPQDKVTAENDILFLMLTELENGEPKEGGLSEKTAMLSLEDIGNETLKKHILTLKKEDTFDADIHDLIKENQKDHVHKYLLGVEDDVQFNDTFRAEILSITNITPAELNAELLVRAIGIEKAKKHVSDFLPKAEEEEEEVASEDSEDAIPEVVELDLEDDKAKEEEEKEHIVTDAERKAVEKGFKAEVVEMMREDFTKNAKARLFQDFREAVLEKNDLALPEAYLKRWMKMNADGNPVSDEEYKLTIEGLKWNILRNEITKKADVYVSYEEVETEFKERYFEMSGMSADDPKADEQFNQFMDTMQQQSRGNLIANMHSSRLKENLEDKMEELITVDKKSIFSKAYGEMLEKEYKEEQKKLEAEKKEEVVVDSSAE